MKKKLLALAIGSVLSAGAQADISNILITEYVEGSSYSKAIEITNTGSDAYTFPSNIVLQQHSGTYKNTIFNESNVSILEGRELQPGKSIVIIHPDASEELQAPIVDKTSIIKSAGYSSAHTDISFNGDDAIAIVDAADGRIIDTIGTSTKNVKWGADKTLRRRLGDGDVTPQQNPVYVANNWNEEKVVVQVTDADGKVTETLTSKNNFSDLGTKTFAAYVASTDPVDPVDPVDPTDPSVVDLEMITEDGGSFQATLARYVGKTVRLPVDINTAEDGNQDMRVTRTFSFDYRAFRNNMVLSYKRPNLHQNQENPAGSDGSKAVAAENKDFSLLIEASTKPDDGNIPYYPNFSADPANNYIRIDDSVIGLEGVISYNYGKYILTVSNTVDSSNFTHNTPRLDRKALDTSLATVKSGDIEIKVATQNVLNYFNSPFGGSYNNHGDNRGATSYAEYDKQKDKIIAAIRGLNADIVGLMEIENNGFGETGAIATLVEEINLAYDEPKLSKYYKDSSTLNRYAFIGFDSNGDVVIDSDDSIGGDAITSGMLYRPAKVTLDAVKIIPMPSQHDDAIVNDNGVVVKNYTNSVLESGDNYMRDSLAATFIVNQTGKKLTVAVNHLKSKGSTCTEDWDGVEFGTTEKLGFNKDKDLLNQFGSNDDNQGNCENFRVAAAVQLGEELNKISGDKVIVGDMNSYAQEDPMLVLTEIPTVDDKLMTITAARKTYIGRVPQVLPSNLVVTKSYGYLNAVGMKDAENGKTSWSYSYESDIGSLDHILITSSLKDRLVDAADWHINAAESALYDYNEDRKGDFADAFYADDVYRSSDHDSAIMVLGYTPGEVDSGEPVHLAISGGWIKVPYTIPAKSGALTGDIAEITLSNQDGDVYVDMSKVSTPEIALTKDGAQVLGFELIGAKSSLYTATMTLKRDGKIVPNSTVSMTVEVAKADSLEPQVVVPEYDETGGSFGMFSIMSLLGLGFLRRRK
jgi:predicted extracellular nuclease